MRLARELVTHMKTLFPQVTTGMIVENGTARCVNTEPLLTTVTRRYEEVAEMSLSVPEGPTPGLSLIHI